MDVEKLNEAVVHDGCLGLADLIEPFFSHHAKAIRDELTLWTMDKETGAWRGQPRRMTESRWNRLADIICSLASLPGPLLSQEARTARLKALCVAEAPRAMARHCIGGKRSYGAIELAVYLTQDLVVAQADTPPKST